MSGSRKDTRLSNSISEYLRKRPVPENGNRSFFIAQRETLFDYGQYVLGLYEDAFVFVGFYFRT